MTAVIVAPQAGAAVPSGAVTAGVLPAAPSHRVLWVVLSAVPVPTNATMPA